jgi:hypothetical protein
MTDQIDSPIEAMYVAGKQDIPAEAELVARISTAMHGSLQQLDAQSALAGDPQVFTSMLTVAGEVYDVMRVALLDLDHCAAAIIATADDFVQHDSQAADDFRLLGSGLRDLPVPTHTAPPPLESPGDPGAVDPVQPSRIGRGDFEPHDPVLIPSTPDPVSPEVDQEQRDETAEDDKADNPVVPPIVEGS